MQNAGDFILKQDLTQGFKAAGALLFSIAIALYFRLQSIPRLTESNLFIGSNSYYHLRNIQYIIANFPNILGFDAYTQYPNGIVQPLVPLYDLKLAGIAYIVGLGHPSISTIYNVCSYMPIIFALITIIFTFLIARELFDNVFAGMLASLFLAVMPGMFLTKSMFGYNDNAIFEAMLCSILMYALIYCFKCLNYEKLTNGTNIPEQSSPYARALGCSIFAGIIFSGLTFGGSLGIIFIPILLFYFAIKNMMDYSNGIDIEHQLICSIAFFTVATVFSYLLSGIFPQLNVVVNDFSFSYLLFGVIGICSIGIASQMIDRTTKSKKWIYYIILPIVAAYFIFAYFRSPELLTLMPHITEPASGTDLRSIFAIEYDLYSANFAACGYITILSLGIIYIKKLSGISLFVFVWSIGTMAACIIESRFAIFYAINVAVLSAYGILKLWDYGVSKIKQRSTNASYIDGAVFIITCLVLASSVSTANSEVNSILNTTDSNIILSDQYLETMNWISTNTPDPQIDINKEIDHPIKYPTSAYGILSANTSGNYIQMIGKRMPVSSPYENESLVVSKFFSSQNESNALISISSSNATIKYIITDVGMTTSNFSVVTAMNESNYANVVIIPNATKNKTGEGFSNLSVSFPHAVYYNATLLRLHIFDGNGLQHFRLVHESTSTHDQREKTIKDTYNFQYEMGIANSSSGDVKVFEYVKGAKIVGKAQSNTTINLTTHIETNQGRIFNYRQVTTADNNGNYNFTVPYARVYQINTNKKLLNANVNESAVINGGIVNGS